MKRIKLLLVVGSSYDVFISNYAKWLKNATDIEFDIDVFEFSNSKGQKVDTSYYNQIYSANCHRWFMNLKGIRSILTPFYKAKDLENFLRDKQYDIIHCHWITNAVVLTSNFKQHCRALVGTFWGGENKQGIVYSNKWYKCKLERFLKSIDLLIGSKIGCDERIKNYPFLNGKCQYGSLGSSPMEYLYSILDSMDSKAAKKFWNIPDDKKSVLIGYSGKSLHRHLDIIDGIMHHCNKRESIHLLAPMTRGANAQYIVQVETALKGSGCSYTLIKERFLSDEEIAKLRIATDIVLQLSTFDGFSRSIVESFCARSIVIYGNWLNNYDKHLDSYGFKGIGVDSIKQGVIQLNRIIEHENEFLDITLENSRNGRNSALWSECIKPWIEAYKQLV